MILGNDSHFITNHQFSNNSNTRKLSIIATLSIMYSLTSSKNDGVRPRRWGGDDMLWRGDTVSGWKWTLVCFFSFPFAAVPWGWGVVSTPLPPNRLRLFWGVAVEMSIQCAYRVAWILIAFLKPNVATVNTAWWSIVLQLWRLNCLHLSTVGYILGIPNNLLISDSLSNS